MRILAILALFLPVWLLAQQELPYPQLTDQDRLIISFQDPMAAWRVESGFWSRPLVKQAPAPGWKGRSALRITGAVKDQVSIILISERLPYDVLEWESTDALHFMVYGDGSGSVFYISFLDHDHEMFQVMQVVRFTGWKELVVPVRSFRSRMDWQPPEARVNRRINYPVRELHVADFYWAHPDIWFGPVWVSRNSSNQQQ